ncbi:hypothetical protein RhoFasB10_00505 [Rhodococcus sp. B10]|nr:hypothetical protein [Rhodococcus sp. B10]
MTSPNPGHSKLRWYTSLRNADLTNAEFRVLVVLSTFTDGSMGNAFPGLRVLAEQSCVSEQTTKHALRSLRLKGWIELSERGGNQVGKGRANVWRLLPRELKGATGLPPSFIPKGVAHLPPSDIPKGGNSSPEGGKSLTPQGGKSLTPHQFIDQFIDQGGVAEVTNVPLRSAQEAPPRRCPTHRGMQGVIPSCGACKELRLQNEAWVKNQTPLARDIARCPDCRGTHWLETETGEPIRKCDHARAPLKEVS